MGDDGISVTYEIVADEELPVFDPSIKVKHKVFNAHQIQLLNTIIWRYKSRIMPSYFIGQGLRLAAIFAPATIGRWIALVAPLFQYSAGLIVLFSFRYEYLKLLLGTFDFWFFTVMNTIWLACFSTIFQDSRICVLPVWWLEYQNAAVIDAFFSDYRNVFVASVASSFLIFALIAVASLELISEGHGVTLFSTGKYTVKASDIMMNAMGTIFILLIRVIYRRWVAIPRVLGKENVRTIQSMGYRCRVKLQPKEGPLPSTISSVTPPTTPATTRNHRAPRRKSVPKKLLSMRFMKVHHSFHSAATVVPSATCYALPMTAVRMKFLYVLGLLCPVLMLRSSNPHTEKQHLFVTLPAISLVTATILFCGQFFCLYQRQILRSVCTSFDFLFLSLQLTFAHVGACDLFAWEWGRCVGLLSSWIWIHWVMTLDALTPIARSRLAFHIHYAAPVLVLRLILQVLLVADVLTGNQQDLHDRVLLQGSIGGHEVKLYLMPFVVSRVVTNLVWCSRLLWRIRARHGPGQLIMLKGNVEYDFSRKQRRRSATVRRNTIKRATTGVLAFLRASRMLSKVSPASATPPK